MSTPPPTSPHSADRAAGRPRVDVTARAGARARRQRTLRRVAGGSTLALFAVTWVGLASQPSTTTTHATATAQQTATSAPTTEQTDAASERDAAGSDSTWTSDRDDDASSWSDSDADASDWSEEDDEAGGDEDDAFEGSATYDGGASEPSWGATSGGSTNQTTAPSGAATAQS